jgi:endonuclease YncB( thermonuclease family)
VGIPSVCEGRLRYIYFGIRADAALEVGNDASEFTKLTLAKPFTIYTRWRRALGRSAIWRYYAIVVTADGHDLNELLVSNGLTRIYGTRTPLPDGRDSRAYLAHLHELETEARAAKRGAWGKVPVARTEKPSPWVKPTASPTDRDFRDMLFRTSPKPTP